MYATIRCGKCNKTSNEMPIYNCGKSIFFSEKLHNNNCECGEHGAIVAIKIDEWEDHMMYKFLILVDRFLDDRNKYLKEKMK